MSVREVEFVPFPDQKPGTAGLRKKVKVFQQAHYLESFLQAIFDLDPALNGGTLVIGGDGRYHNRTAIQTAIRMAVANGVRRVVVGQGGLLSTPAASNLIRVHDADGGFLLTASHNPAGPDDDFGIKYNVAGGGQAPESLTNRIYAHTQQLKRYRIVDAQDIDLDQIAVHRLGDGQVEIVDAVADYAALMQSLFDFDRLRDWFRQGHRLRFDAMHAVTGPYAKRIFVELLGAPPDSVTNATPLEDFAGGHPDPNLIYAKDLVALMNSNDAPDLGGASDGDGDRNMILGPRTFISPGDSLAMLCAHLHRCPGYVKGLSGVARSMPTSRAVDHVAKSLGMDCYETPTGWKFFANLLDADRVTLCGEESFGTSSNHTREKDGVWAVLAWLNVLAATGQSVAEIARAHWKTHGRHYYQRHDYEGLSAETANAVMDAVRSQFPNLPGNTFGAVRVSTADEFQYQDPIDGSVAKAQGLRVTFGDAARVVLRLSGTGTAGATLRLYLERYESHADRLGQAPEDALAPIAEIAEQIAGIRKVTGKEKPDVVT